MAQMAPAVLRPAREGETGLSPVTAVLPQGQEAQ